MNRSLAAMLAFAPLAAPAWAQTALTPVQNQAVYISHGDVDHALAALPKGMGLASLGAVRAGDDRVNVDMLKRTDAGAEGPVYHKVVTEIYVVTDGGGVMETGGTIDDPKPMERNGKPLNVANIGPSMRGTKMTGGTTHHVGVGDVVMIPPGVVHRFVSLDGSVTYLAIRFNPGFEKGR